MSSKDSPFTVHSQVMHKLFTIHSRVKRLQPIARRVSMLPKSGRAYLVIEYNASLHQTRILQRNFVPIWCTSLFLQEVNVQPLVKKRHAFRAVSALLPPLFPEGTRIPQAEARITKVPPHNTICIGSVLPI